MTDKEREEYELALRTGRKRFGSACLHERVKGGHCIKCRRKVVTTSSRRGKMRRNEGEDNEELIYRLNNAEHAVEMASLKSKPERVTRKIEEIAEEIRELIEEIESDE